jgi:stress response protein SCP2
VEFFNGTEFVTLSSGDVDYTVDNFTGNGVQTDFTMTVAESTATQIMVFVGSIYQEPVTAYTVNGSVTLTFTSAPPNTVPINVIHTSS